jgi:iron complex outermembrane receptor protein
MEAAVGSGLTNELSARVSLLSQHRDHYINNNFTKENDVMGGFDETAGRLQFLYEAGNVSALLNVHGRKLDGTSSIFRRNVFTKGSNGLNATYDRENVAYDGGNNFQKYDNSGASLKLDFDLNDMTFTSITAHEQADGNGRADVDGGNAVTGPGTSAFDAVTEDQLKDLKQLTQEFRLASDTSEALEWQVGAFYFDSSFGVTSIDGFLGQTSVYNDNQSWAVFGQSTYNLSDRWDVTGGIRYTHDKKSLNVGEQNVNANPFAVENNIVAVQNYAPINLSDGQVSWELATNYRLTDQTSLFARFANGFRAQSIQGRNVAFEGDPTTAKSETINSIEVGGKSDLLNNTLRLNGAVFYYNIDDLQLSAIGGNTNGNSLVNAEEGTGYGFEIDADWRALSNLTLGGGFSYNKTELKDPNLRVAACQKSICTPLDKTIEVGTPQSTTTLAYVNGNPFPQAPKTILTFNARYDIPVKSGEIYFYSDVAFQGETNLFLYDSVEFKTDNNMEAGLRIGYQNYDGNYEVALYGRNITDEDNVKGAVDFANLAGFVNEPRIIGVEFKKSFF